MYVLHVSFNIGIPVISRKPHLPEDHDREKQPPVAKCSVYKSVDYTCMKLEILMHINLAT